ncbi:MAG: rhomboid family intramembrane serine protease [Candidatus Aenigmatarchaeota archaeon]
MRLTDFWSLRLTVACIIIFILQLAIPTLTDSLALISSDILVRPWILITSMFAHGSIEHLLYNMFALALFGTILENIIGSRRWLILYFISGIIASIAAAAFYPESLGASGAIFGLLGTLAVLRPRITVWVAGIPMPMAVAAGVWAIGDLLGLFVPSGIANAAHLAGLATGIMFGIALRKKFGEPLFIKKKLAKDIDEETFRRWEREWL